MTQTPIALARLAAERLSAAGIENARLEAELLLGAVLGLRRLDLYLQHDRPLTPDEVAAYRAAARRRLRREPLQYIVGEAPFRELTLRVDPRVLIPRPETEVLVGEVLAWAERMSAERAKTERTSAERAWEERSGAERANAGPARASGVPVAALAPDSERGALHGAGAAAALTALDVGTGSGAIALSLAHEGPFARVVATDASADALDAAAGNAERLGLAARVSFRCGSLFEAVRAERFDVVVSNPPYIGGAERAELMPEVRDWEPSTALYSPGGGLDLLFALVRDAPRHLRSGGLLALEVGERQARAVAGRAEASGAYGSVRIVRDLAGRDRIVLATAGRAARDEARDRSLAGPNEKGDHA